MDEKKASLRYKIYTVSHKMFFTIYEHFATFVYCENGYKKQSLLVNTHSITFTFYTNIFFYDKV